MGTRPRTIDEISQAIRRALSHDARGVAAVYVYGSRARGTPTSASDVDVAIIREGTAAVGFGGLPLEIEGILERALGLPVGVVDLATAPADLVHRILRDGRLVIDRDPARRIALEVRRRNEYFALLPLLHQYRRARQPA